MKAKVGLQFLIQLQAGYRNTLKIERLKDQSKMAA